MSMSDLFTVEKVHDQVMANQVIRASIYQKDHDERYYFAELDRELQ